MMEAGVGGSGGRAKVRWGEEERGVDGVRVSLHNWVNSSNHIKYPPSVLESCVVSGRHRILITPILTNRIAKHITETL